MVKLLAQYKGKADQEHWYDLFKDYDIREKVKSMKNSRLYSIFCRYIPLKAKVIEGGSGMGKISISLLERGNDVIGIDYSKKLIKKVQTEVPEWKNNFVLMDARALKYPPKTFDTYISPGVIEHFFEENERIEILNEAYRVLKDDGILICIVPYMNLIKTLKYPFLKYKNNQIRRKGVAFYQFIYTKNELIRILSLSNFKIKNVELLGLHDTKLFGKRIVPKVLQNNKILLSIFGTTICAICEKRLIH